MPVFDNYMRENKTLFADAPQDGVPLVLRNDPSSRKVVAGLEALVSEFQSRLET